MTTKTFDVTADECAKQELHKDKSITMVYKLSDDILEHVLCVDHFAPEGQRRLILGSWVSGREGALPIPRRAILVPAHSTFLEVRYHDEDHAAVSTWIYAHDSYRKCGQTFDVYISINDKDVITVYTEEKYEQADNMYRKVAGVNWSAIGTVTASEAEEFSTALRCAAAIANILNIYEVEGYQTRKVQINEERGGKRSA